MKKIYRRAPIPKCSPVKLLHIFKTLFPNSTSGWLLLSDAHMKSLCKKTRQKLSAIAISYLNFNQKSLLINSVAESKLPSKMNVLFAFVEQFPNNVLQKKSLIFFNVCLNVKLMFFT